MRPCLFPKVCVRALEGRLELEIQAQAEAWHESGLVITTKLGQPVDPSNFYRAFQTRWRRADDLTVHAPARSAHRCSLPCMYNQVTSESTLRELKALDEQLERHWASAPAGAVAVLCCCSGLLSR